MAIRQAKFVPSQDKQRWREQRLGFQFRVKGPGVRHYNPYAVLTKTSEEPALTLDCAATSDPCQSSRSPSTVTIIRPSIRMSMSAAAVSTLSVTPRPAVPLPREL